MRRRQVSVAAMTGLVAFAAVGLAGFRSGSEGWFAVAYAAAVTLLVGAAIAARYRGPFWYGFAVAGWAYLLLGLGPWARSPHDLIDPASASAPAARPLTTPGYYVNPALPTSRPLAELAERTIPQVAYDVDLPPLAYRSLLEERARRVGHAIGVGHLLASVLAALLGGAAAEVLARSSDRRGGPLPGV